MEKVVTLVRLKELEFDGGNDPLAREDAEILRHEIDRELLARYDALRARFGETALIPMERGSCAACNMGVPSVQALLLANDFVECDSCGRLIYDPELIYNSYIS